MRAFPLNCALSVFSLNSLAVLKISWVHSAAKSNTRNMHSTHTQPCTSFGLQWHYTNVPLSMLAFILVTCPLSLSLSLSRTHTHNADCVDSTTLMYCEWTTMQNCKNKEGKWHRTLNMAIAWKMKAKGRKYLSSMSRTGHLVEVRAHSTQWIRFSRSFPQFDLSIVH